MNNRTVLVALAVALCATPALGTVDVAIDIVRPDTFEIPGIIPVTVRLTNMGDTSALVESVKVTISVGYNSFTTGIQIDPSQSKLVYMPIPWVCPAGCYETCTAWITYPADVNHSNDTDIVVVRTGSTWDVATEIASPEAFEAPGLVTVQIRLANVGELPARVPRLDVTIRPSGYWDHRESIPVSYDSNQVVTLNPWSYSGGSETCIAWITYPDDTNGLNDADAVIVDAVLGMSGQTSMRPHAGISMVLSPSPATTSALHIEYSLDLAGPARVTLFDVSGRVVLTRGFAGSPEGVLPLDLGGLNGGVYIVRLHDGRSSVTQKLVLQR